MHEKSSPAFKERIGREDNQTPSSQKRKIESPRIETSSFKFKNRERRVVCIELNSSKTIDKKRIQVFQKDGLFNLNLLHGLYAFVLVFTNDNHQYLLINPLKDYESNHGYLCLFLKKIKGYDPLQSNMTIKAGGEIGRRLRSVGVSFEDRQDLLGHRSGRITTHYSSAELQNLFDAANKVCEKKQSGVVLTLLRNPNNRKDKATQSGKVVSL